MTYGGGVFDDDGAQNTARMALLEWLMVNNAPGGDREPISEQQLADRLSVPKSSLREAAIELRSRRLLRKTREGLVRVTLDPTRLLELFSNRYRIEMLSIRALAQENLFARRRKTEVLLAFVDRQAQRVGKNIYEWIIAGMAFHAQMTQEAGYETHAELLQDILLQLRIASNVRPDTTAQQEKAVREHRELAMLIGTGDVVGCERALEVHLLASAARFFEAQSPVEGASVIEGSNVPDWWWKGVRELAMMGGMAPSQPTHV